MSLTILFFSEQKAEELNDYLKKKFKDTKVGKFLLGKSGIINVIGDILPDQGALGMVKNLIDKDPDLPPQDKETALKLLEQDTIELQEVSKRWESDMKSDSWLSKNTRPMTLIFLTLSLVVFILLDGFDISFGIDTGWIDLLKSLLITVYVAYFGSRGAEKFKSIGNNPACPITLSSTERIKGSNLLYPALYHQRQLLVKLLCLL
mgnify:CR=1 FL=1